MLGRTPPKPAKAQPDTDVQVAWLVHQRDQALQQIDAVLAAHSGRHTGQSLSLPDVLLDLRNTLAPPRGARR